MKDQYANYVVQKILEVSNDKHREILLSRIKVHLHALKKYTYGKHIVARFEQLSGEGTLIIFFFDVPTGNRPICAYITVTNIVLLCNGVFEK